MTSPVKSLAKRMRSWFMPRKPRTFQHRARLNLEVLEDRIVPTSVAVIGVNSSFTSAMKNQLVNSGQFTSPEVTELTVTNTAPSLASLLAYDGLLVSSDGGFNAGVATEGGRN